MTAYPLNALNPYLTNPMQGLGGFPMMGMNPMMSMGLGSVFNYGYDSQFGGLDAYSPDTPMFAGNGFGMGFGMPYGAYGYNMDKYLNDMTNYSAGMTKAGIKVNGIQIDGQKDLYKQSLKAQLANAGLGLAYSHQYNAPAAALNKDLGGIYTATTQNNQEAIMPAVDRAADEVMKRAKALGDPITKDEARAIVMQNFSGVAGGQSLQEAIAENGQTASGHGFMQGFFGGALALNKKSASETIAELSGVPVSPEDKLWEKAGKYAGYGATGLTLYGGYLVATHKGTPGFFSRLCNPKNWRWLNRLRELRGKA